MTIIYAYNYYTIEVNEHMIVAFDEDNGTIITSSYEEFDGTVEYDDNYHKLLPLVEKFDEIKDTCDEDAVEYVHDGMDIADQRREAAEKKAAAMQAKWRAEHLEVLGVTADGERVYKHATASHSHRTDLDAEAISHIKAEGRGFIRETVDLRRVIGVDHLVETDSTSEIFYMKRGNRDGESRFVLNKAAEETSKVTVILCRDKDPGPTYGLLCMVTLFEGMPGEREPWDESVQDDPKAKAKAEAFWATHALVPTEEELNKIIELI